MRKQGHFWYTAQVAYDDFQVSVHWFPLEADPAKNTYRATTSLNWFQERVYNQTNNMHIRLESMHAAILLEHVRAKHPDYIYDWQDCNHSYHESLWAFYEAIGYDRKTKKFGKGIPIEVMTHERLLAKAHEVDPHFGFYQENAERHVNKRKAQKDANSSGVSL